MRAPTAPRPATPGPPRGLSTPALPGLPGWRVQGEGGGRGQTGREERGSVLEHVCAPPMGANPKGTSHADVTASVPGVPSAPPASATGRTCPASKGQHGQRAPYADASPDRRRAPGGPGGLPRPAHPRHWVSVSHPAPSTWGCVLPLLATPPQPGPHPAACRPALAGRPPARHDCLPGSEDVWSPCVCGSRKLCHPGSVQR